MSAKRGAGADEAPLERTAAAVHFVRSGVARGAATAQRRYVILHRMRLSHVNVTMPKGGEEIARSFYAELLGLREIPKPSSIRHRGGVWFEAGGLDVHLSIEEERGGADAARHFGLECADVEGLRGKLGAAGIATEDGRPVPWRRFFVHDPFGNRIEIHEVGGLRA